MLYQMHSESKTEMLQNCTRGSMRKERPASRRRCLIRKAGQIGVQHRDAVFPVIF